MKTYIGTKRLNAKPMTRGEYNAMRGWELPADENGEDEGYLVEYVSGGSEHGGKSNVEGFAGYVSWSPKDVFEAAYQPTDMMNFSCALMALDEGKRVARHGWNGKGMFIEMQLPDDQSKMRRSFIFMSPVDGELVPWVASQTDLTAGDWYIVEQA